MSDVYAFAGGVEEVPENLTRAVAVRMGRRRRRRRQVLDVGV
jgi:hypothetical protein